MTDRKSEEVNHFVLTLQRLLPAVLIVVALGAPGCQSREDTGVSEQTQVEEAQVIQTITPTSGSSLGPSPTETPTPTLQSPPTPTPDDTSTPAPPTEANLTPTSSLPSAPVVGAVAPMLTLPDLTGNEVSLTGLRGKAVLLNFWATW